MIISTIMSYGKLRRLLSKEFRDIHDTILIESPFIETTRKGKYLYATQLALTPNELVIAQEPPPRKLKNDPIFEDTDINIQYLYPLELVQINIFKRSHRQSLKFCIESGRTRYFELAPMKKRKLCTTIVSTKRHGVNYYNAVAHTACKLKCNGDFLECEQQVKKLRSSFEIFWELWCYHAVRLHGASKLLSDIRLFEQTDSKINERKSVHMTWCDKHLYLGSRREKEDAVRPIPVPGLGPTEDIKLLYLKQKYFGCWDQSEHWVQCGSSGSTIFNF